jgi:thiol:disulfide interchange protein DsbG
MFMVVLCAPISPARIMVPIRFRQFCQSSAKLLFTREVDMRVLIPMIVLLTVGGASAFDDAIPPALTAPLSKGYTIAKRFEGPSGLTGWLMRDPEGVYYTFWTTSDGKYMLDGALVDERGNDLTESFQVRYKPPIDTTTLWSQLEKAAQIVTGPVNNQKSEIYIFVDPNCPYCHLLWRALRPYETAGLQIHWIEVAFLREDSAGKAAALLTSSDKARALEFSQTSFERGGIRPLTSIPENVSKRLADNLVLMHLFGFLGVPGIVCKDSKGMIQTRSGMPRISDLPRLTGIGKQRLDFDAPEEVGGESPLR